MNDAVQKLKVFVSYSHRDHAFVDELTAGLKLAGFLPVLDQQDVSAGDNWEERLGGLILQSDTVAFVVSSFSVRSERCLWELARALQLSKRLIPIVLGSVPESEIPEQLRQLRFIRFENDSRLTRSLAEVADALQKDLHWIREHTRIGELAARWEMRGRSTSLLLREDELSEALHWMSARPAGAPEITQLQEALLSASAEQERAAKAAAVRSRQLGQQTRLAIRIIFTAGILAIAYQLWSHREYALLQLADFADQLRRKVAAEGSVPREGDSFTDCARCPTMIVVPPGEFEMGSKDGSEDEKPVHNVTISAPFAVSRFEIQFDEWDACYLLGGCPKIERDVTAISGTRPVVEVSWYEARDFAAWLSRRTGHNYRLLSEAEWEYAARAKSKTLFPWGQTLEENRANCSGCRGRDVYGASAEAGSFLPNDFGLFHMLGNVWEWVQDCYSRNYDDAHPDGSANSEGHCNFRVVRGGSWDFGPEFLRPTLRQMDVPESKRSNLGFRIARTFARQGLK